MAFRFRCTKCGKRLTVEESPGAEVTCQHCNQAISVPDDAQAMEDELEGIADESPVPVEAEAVAAVAEPAPAAEEPQEEEPPPGGMDTVMGWLALYLPSWGTSVVLHAAVFILAAFMVWQTQTIQAPFEYKSAVVSETKHKTEKRKKIKKQESRGKLKPNPSSIVRQFTQNPVPDVATNKMEVLQVIGVGGGGKVLGEFEGLGTGGRGFFGAGSETEVAHKIVYVVDRSGSMTDSIDYVKFELKRSIGELGEDTEFHVIFYSSGPPVEMPTRRLVAGTERNKELAFEFIDGIIPQGETDPSKALERAFAVGPELIYLLTDGEFDKAIIDLVKRVNVGEKVTVHTIGFLYRTGEEVLKQIAEQNNGNYKFVSEADLATLAN
ncbi:MAG: VWA domain-containing protein [Planctomycetes bacterium]|nr:VWA domain-containing protein [Planctomycetota bacterium]